MTTPNSRHIALASASVAFSLLACSVDMGTSPQATYTPYPTYTTEPRPAPPSTRLSPTTGPALQSPTRSAPQCQYPGDVTSADQGKLVAI